MGYSHRKLSQLQALYSKKLKEPIENVIKLMPPGFSDIEFLTEFRRCYAYLWDDLCKEHRYYERKNKTFNGKKPLFFPETGTFVLKSGYRAIKKARLYGSKALTQAEQTALRNALIDKCDKTLRKRRERIKEHMDILQDVVPNYVSHMIKSYFHNRRINLANVNIRYYILNEIAKFDNKRLIGFFSSVMKSERNDVCREFAFRTLQKWDKTVQQPKKRRGEKWPNEDMQPVIPSNPNQLMDMICLLQMEKDKSYNVFLSHRSTDKDIVIKIKEMLNSKGLSVYVDWMQDREGLPRDKMNENTLNVLKTRILQSNCLLYVHTMYCRDSDIIPIEIEFAENQHIPIIVLNIDNSSELEFTQGKTRALVRNQEIFVMNNNKELSIDKWINIIKR